MQISVGIPFGIKDIIDASNMLPSGLGTPFYENNIPVRDTSVAVSASWLRIYG